MLVYQRVQGPPSPQGLRDSPEDNSVNVTVFHDGGLTGSKVELGVARCGS